MQHLSLKAAIEYVSIAPGAVTMTIGGVWPDWIDLFTDDAGKPTQDHETITRLMDVKGLVIHVHEVMSLKDNFLLGYIFSIPANVDLGVPHDVFLSEVMPEARDLYGKPVVGYDPTVQEPPALTEAQVLKLIAISETNTLVAYQEMEVMRRAATSLPLWAKAVQAAIIDRLLSINQHQD